MPKTLTAPVTGQFILVFLCLFAGARAQTVIFSSGASWKYLDNGTNQGTAWRAPAFTDASWKSGAAQLGYGDGDEATIVSYGSSASAKYVTTYFRKSFAVAGKKNYASFKIDYKRDDGIIVYVNGTEVHRNNMPSGTISYTTLASASASDDGSTVKSAIIAPNYFSEGNNVIAVEIHQNARNSTDISFEMQLTGNLAAPAAIADTIVRGPYLQMVNQNAITIRWATNTVIDSKVSYGPVSGSLTNSATDTTKTTEHEIRLTGLTADTRYYYSVGKTTAVLEQTNKNFFTTAPAATTARKIRIAAYGDCGNNSINQVNVKNAYLSYMGTNTTDVWLLLGDNAYNAGTAAEYQSNFFNIYKSDLLKNMPVFPTPGNHDYGNNPARQDDHVIPYLSFFTLPKNAECGGVASGKKEYYSFDYGDIHFICLDSYGEELNKRFFDTTGQQALWLKSDLAANQRKWTIAFWHHPPYTMGSHNSDTDADLAAVRTNLIRILERNGVDLILNGHSHSYERSYLLHDHFGLENTFSLNANAVTNSSAKYNGTANSCPYISTAAKTKHGTVYVVAGSAGQVGGTQSSFPHSAMYYSNATNGGSLAIEIQGNRLDAKFIGADSSVRDQFTILKDVKKTTTLSAAPGQPLTISASWEGNYSWNTGDVVRSITVNKAAAGQYDYYVSDNSNASNKCLTDTFHINITATANRPALQPAANPGRMFSFKAYPNPGKVIRLAITSGLEQNMQYVVEDLNGRIVCKKDILISAGVTSATIGLPGGMYVVKVGNATTGWKTREVEVR